MARVQFFDDPSGSGRSREDVRINQIGLHVYPDGKRVAVGFDLTPFRERPSIEVTVRNERGEIAARMHVIESVHASFHLTMHLRDQPRASTYDVLVVLYYAAPGEARQVVDQKAARFERPLIADEEE